MTRIGASRLTTTSLVSSPTWSSPKIVAEIPVLLVRQRRDRRGVDGPRNVLAHHEDPEFPRDRLPGPIRGGDQHGVAIGEGTDRLELKVVKLVRQAAVNSSTSASGVICYGVYGCKVDASSIPRFFGRRVLLQRGAQEAAKAVLGRSQRRRKAVRKSTRL